jgi:hypothetical protein
LQIFYNFLHFFHATCAFGANFSLFRLRIWCDTCGVVSARLEPDVVSENVFDFVLFANFPASLTSLAAPATGKRPHYFDY